MKVYFKFIIEMKARVQQDTHQEKKNQEVSERVQRLAQRIAADKVKMTEVYKITFLDLLQGDYYCNVLHRKMKLKKEKEIIQPVAAEMEQKDSAFFKSLYEEPLDESLSKTKDEALNKLFAQFKNPTITDVHFECTEAESEQQKKENIQGAKF